jgi:hypothetical protein
MQRMKWRDSGVCSETALMWKRVRERRLKRSAIDSGLAAGDVLFSRIVRTSSTCIAFVRTHSNATRLWNAASK